MMNPIPRQCEMKIIIEEPSSTGKLNKVNIHSLFTCYSVNTPHMLNGGSISCEKEGDLTQSYDKTPIPTENSKTKGQHTQTPPKTSIAQQLRTDLGRSFGVTSNPTGVVKPV